MPDQDPAASDAGPLDPEEKLAAEAEARLAELEGEAESPSRLRRWQFGLGPALVLLSVVAIYLGMTRSFHGAYAFVPLWVEISSGVALFIWLLAIMLRTGMRVGVWREGRQRSHARREALEQLIEAKRAQKQHEPGEATTTDPPTSP